MNRGLPASLLPRSPTNIDTFIYLLAMNRFTHMPAHRFTYLHPYIYLLSVSNQKLFHMPVHLFTNQHPYICLSVRNEPGKPAKGTHRHNMAHHMVEELCYLPHSRMLLTSLLACNSLLDCRRAAMYLFPHQSTSTIQFTFTAIHVHR